MSNCCSLTGSLSIGQGARGKSLEFQWRGTSLGVRVEGDAEYQFVDLGIEGGKGKEVQLQVSGGYIQWKYSDEEEWKNLIAISELKGDKGLDGKSAYDLWLEKGNEGTLEDFLSSLKGKDGEKGEQGLPGTNGADGKDGITPNIQIGTVTTLEPGQNATVENVGTKEEPVFNFGIPKGADGIIEDIDIPDNSITPQKTTFMKYYSNFDKDYFDTNEEIVDFSTHKAATNSINTYIQQASGGLVCLFTVEEGYVYQVEVSDKKNCDRFRLYGFYDEFEDFSESRIIDGVIFNTNENEEFYTFINKGYKRVALYLSSSHTNATATVDIVKMHGTIIMDDKIKITKRNLIDIDLNLEEQIKELQSVNQQQDELINISLCATDEMFMMLEPLLVNTYNIGGNSKMVEMYVAMCIRGLKKIEDVPVRYREQVIEILNKLED